MHAINHETRPDERADAFAAPHQILHTGSGAVALYRFGRGPDVVFVHGWPLHAATFRRIVPLLADRYTLHFIDLPGTGNSVDWAGRVDFVSHAAVVRAAVDRLGLASYALVAHDSGGVVARLVAADDPRVSALVLSGTEIPGHRPPLVGELAAAVRVPGGGALLRAAIRSAAFLRSSRGFGGCFEDPEYALGEFRELFIEPLVRSKRVYEGQARLLQSLDFDFIDRLTEVHARIHAPTLCIWGDEDPFFPLGLARGMLAQFAGGAQMVVVPGAKLFVNEDHPEAFAAHTAAFLAGHAAPGRATGAA